MKHLFPKFLALAFFVVTVFAHASTVGRNPIIRSDTTGFYPLWENTGHVERSGNVRLGTTGVQIGMPGLHVGALPLPFFYRTPNAYLKGSLYAGERFSSGLQVGFFHLLPAASKSAFSPMYPTRLDNSDFSLTVIPMHLSASWTMNDWIEWHHTLGAVANLPSGNIVGDFTPGYLSTFEVGPFSSHGLLFTFGEIGFNRHEFWLAGASYRFRNSWLELRLGYFYRFRVEGAQSGPLGSLAFLL